MPRSSTEKRIIKALRKGPASVTLYEGDLSNCPPLHHIPAPARLEIRGETLSVRVEGGLLYCTESGYHGFTDSPEEAIRALCWLRDVEYEIGAERQVPKGLVEGVGEPRPLRHVYPAKGWKELAAQIAPHRGSSLVLWTSEWCGPCQAMKPILERVHGAGTPVYVVDVEASGELAERLGIEYVPVLVVLRGKSPVDLLAGGASLAEINAALAAHP